jgi:preprotein translocase subunit SecG
MTTVTQLVAVMLGLGSLLPLVAVAIFMRRRSLTTAIAVPVVAAVSIIATMWMVLLGGIGCGGSTCADGHVVLAASTFQSTVHTCTVILIVAWAIISFLCVNRVRRAR